MGRSGKPSLVVVKKQKAALSDDVPFDDVRLVVDANGEYRLFVYHFELVRRGTIDIKQPELLRDAINEVVENRPCPGVDIKITGQQDYLSSEVEEQTLPWRRVLSRNCARLIKNAQCESGRKCRTVRTPKPKEVSDSRNKKKIENLSHIMGPTPILEMARAYGLRPRLWLLIRDNIALRLSTL